jgi:hypothetical protein
MTSTPIFDALARELGVGRESPDDVRELPQDDEGPLSGDLE